MKYWITKYTPVYLLASVTSKRILYLPEKTVVETNGYSDPTIGLTRVIYDPDKPTVSIGWIVSSDLEPYIRNLPENCVDMQGLQTTTFKDFLQFIVYGGIQTNMCGELCVSFIYNVGIRDFMETWKRENPSFMKRVFGAGKARGTGSYELVEMFRLFHAEAQELQSVLKRYTPASLQKLTLEGSAIVSCKIDGGTGLIRGSGTGHWIVVTKVTPERNGLAWVEYFNPANNCIEKSSWNEFIASAGTTPYGAYLKA